MGDRRLGTFEKTTKNQLFYFILQVLMIKVMAT